VALHAASAAVDQAHLPQPPLRGGLQVGVHDVGDLGGSEAVQVEGVPDLDRDGLREGTVVLHG
jgi:hypothetical protein